MRKRGFFITIEGGDGAGKSTQTRLLVRHLKRRGLAVTHTREPGGTFVAEALRKVLLHPKSRIAPLTELFLYEAARAQHVAETVLPALTAGKTVLCERYTDATEAYQGWGRGLDRPTINLLNRIATGGLRPDLTLYLASPVSDGLRRARGRKNGGDRLERESEAFHRRVQAGYRAIAKREPRRMKVVEWKEGVDTVRAQVAVLVDRILEKKR